MRKGFNLGSFSGHKAHKTASSVSGQGHGCMSNKIAIITANMGNFDKNIDPVEQSVKADFFRFIDSNFPPRYQAMTSRFQARIPKMFGWQMNPGYDFYIYI